MTPELSVIVAAVDGRDDVVETLRAVREQDPTGQLDVLLVANAGHAGLDAAAAMTGVTIVVSDVPRLVPELWGLGVAASRGAIVALLTAACVPGPCWVQALLRLHEGDVAAVGGPLGQRAPAALGDWALYFARYAAFVPPADTRDDAEVPGDNGSWKREAIAPDLDHIARRGFWELEVNAGLRSRGRRLVMSDDVTVWHTHSFGIGAFCRQRWAHGRLHGRSRAASGTSAAVACAAPLAWGSMLLRVSRRVLTRGHHRSTFAAALPVIALFYACWVGGEAVGLMQGRA